MTLAIFFAMVLGGLVLAAIYEALRDLAGIGFTVLAIYVLYCIATRFIW